MTQNLKAMTMPEFFYERFEAKYIKLVTASIIFIFLTPYSASVFKGLGHLFEVNFNISYDIALLIMIVITGIYLVLGGYFAIILNDFIQGFIMIIGSITIIAVLVGKGGGFSHIIQNINHNYAQHIPGANRPGFILLFSLVFMTSFGTWGLPQMVQKFYAIKDEKFIVKAAIVSTIFSVIIVFSAYFNGALTHVFYSGVPTINSKPAFDRFIPDMLNRHLPDALMAIILLLILSASMSTLSSLVLVSASSVAIDMYKGHVNPDISKKSSLAMMRFLSGIIIISYLIARYEIAIIITLMSLSWGVVAGSFMAPYIYGLYWKKATKAGVWAGIISGFVTAISLFFILGPAKTPIASTIAMIVPFFVVPIVSVFTSIPGKKTLKKAFSNI